MSSRTKKRSIDTNKLLQNLFATILSLFLTISSLGYEFQPGAKPMQYCSTLYK